MCSAQTGDVQCISCPDCSRAFHRSCLTGFGSDPGHPCLARFRRWASFLASIATVISDRDSFRLRLQTCSAHLDSAPRTLPSSEFKSTFDAARTTNARLKGFIDGCDASLDTCLQALAAKRSAFDSALAYIESKGDPPTLAVLADVTKFGADTVEQAIVASNRLTGLADSVSDHEKEVTQFVRACGDAVTADQRMRNQVCVRFVCSRIILFRRTVFRVNCRQTLRVDREGRIRTLQSDPTERR